MQALGIRSASIWSSLHDRRVDFSGNDVATSTSTTRRGRTGRDGRFPRGGGCARHGARARAVRRALEAGGAVAITDYHRAQECHRALAAGGLWSGARACRPRLARSRHPARPPRAGGAAARRGPARRSPAPAAGELSGGDSRSETRLTSVYQVVITLYAHALDRLEREVPPVPAAACA